MDAHSVGGLPAPVVTLLGVWGVMLVLVVLSHWPNPQVVLSRCPELMSHSASENA